MIHIGRAGVNLGSFSEFEVRQGIAKGRFLLTDLGWKEGMETWTPLSQFEEFATPPPPMPPLPGSEALQEPVAEPGEAIGLPWDHRGQIGLFAAFAETVWLVLLNPLDAFTRMRASGSLADPLLFNLIGGWFGGICAAANLLLVTKIQPAAQVTGWQALFSPTPAAAMWDLKIFIFMGPIIVTVSTMIFAGIGHLFLMLAGGANKEFQVSLRVFCFGYGSAQILQIIPFGFGNLLAFIWMLFCCALGLAAAHGTTTGRSVAAVVLLFLTCIFCCVGAAVLVVGAAYAK